MNDVHQPEPTASTGPRATTVVIGALAAVVFLVVGAIVGLLVAPGRDSGGATTPNAVDIGFAQDMMVHHRQGVLMAHHAQVNNADPQDQVWLLAYDIENTQLAQVGIMQGWLQVWDKPELSMADETMGWMSAGGGHSHGAPAADAPAVAPATDSVGSTERPIMPGMATNAEMAHLASLRGVESDIYFLQLMIRHHQGGIPMMEYAATHANTTVVRTLSGHMLNTQVGEINKMTTMLENLGGEPLPAP